VIVLLINICLRLFVLAQLMVFVEDDTLITVTYAIHYPNLLIAYFVIPDPELVTIGSFAVAAEWHLVLHGCLYPGGRHYLLTIPAPLITVQQPELQQVS